MTRNQLEVMAKALSHWRACMEWNINSLHATEKEKAECQADIDAIDAMEFNIQVKPAPGPIRGVLGPPQPIGGFGGF